ncbi:MAG: S-adenosylmethionine decarboxylase family protein [Candidatus Hodarchaeales archaeon]
MKNFGKELIIDLHNCENIPCNRKFLKRYCKKLCRLIDMKREDLHFWDYEGDKEGYKKAEDHLKGISLIQFIKTSNITIHTVDVPKNVYLNIFSCKDFDSTKTLKFSANFFKGEIVSSNDLKRM